MNDRVRALLAAHPILDGHNDLPFALRDLVDYDLDRYDLTQRQASTQTDFVRLAEGGVGAQFWSVYVPSGWVSAPPANTPWRNASTSTSASTFPLAVTFPAMLPSFTDG